MANIPPDKVQEAIDAANSMTTSMDGLKNEMAKVSAKQRRQRNIITALVVSIVLDVILSIALAFAFMKVDHAADKAADAAKSAEQNAVNTTQACLSSNEARRTQVELWGQVFSVIGEQRLPEIPDLERKVNQAFAQRNCS
jgi:nitrate reductase NapE component